MKYFWGVISMILVMVFFVSGYAIVAFDDDDTERNYDLNHTINASSTLAVTDDLKTGASPDSVSSNGTKHYVINVSDSPIVGEN